MSLAKRTDHPADRRRRRIYVIAISSVIGVLAAIGLLLPVFVWEASPPPAQKTSEPTALHGIYARVLVLFATDLINDGERPDKRFGLSRVDDQAGSHWTFKR
jgi:hypothetical protein